jgi:pimeloyl-ACP methyl ester carboxylesterase
MYHRMAWLRRAFVVFALAVCWAAVAQAQSKPKRPIVVVPGILGSKLCNGSELVWGGASSLANFGRLNLDKTGTEPLRPCGLLDKISILGPFWKIEAYEGLIQTLKGLGYEEGVTLFIFTYDWRQSNVDNAQLLGDFISRINVPTVDIVAHSMGGLVSTIYLHNYDGPKRVRKVIFLGTPFLGSMNALGTLSEGWGTFQNMIAGGMDTIRSTAFSLPAIYELLPNYENCCRIGTRTDYTSVDLTDPAVWRQYGWLPAEYDKGERANYFDDRLFRAKQVHEIMRRPFPSTVSAVRVVGDAFATNLYLVVPRSSPSWKNWAFVKARGDETVPAWSAANNISSLEGTTPSFNVHGTIFNDHTIKSVLERELLDMMMPKIARVRALPTTYDLKPFEFIEVSLEPSVVPIEQSAKIRLAINWASSIKRGEYSPRAVLIGSGAEISISFAEITTDQDLARNALVFEGEVKAPSQPGLWRIKFDFGDFDGDYVAVLATYVR